MAKELVTAAAAMGDRAMRELPFPGLDPSSQRLSKCMALPATSMDAAPPGLRGSTPQRAPHPGTDVPESGSSHS